MSGFQHAPITKGMMVILGLTTLTVALTDLKPYVHLQVVPHMTTYHQFWRILVHPLAFANSAELLMAEMLLYHVGVHIERSFGPRKYSSFVLVSSVLSTLLSLVCVILLAPFGISSVPAGPYGVMFSLMWQYRRTVPALYAFKLFGIEASNKSFMYFLGLMLAISSPPTTIAASLIGLVTGYIYRTDTLFPLPTFSRRRAFRPLKTYRIPLSLHVLLARLFSPLSGSSAPPRRSHRTLPGQVDARATATATSTAAQAQAQSSLRSMLTSRLAAAQRQEQRADTPAAAAAAPVSAGEPGGSGPATSGGARQAMGEWVNEMTGRGNGARAPSEEEIATLTNMFPNMGRETIVRALQRSNHNTAQAVEALLQEGS